ncbi:TadE/TadG family type IV pilus assembly protein [Rhodopirellula halodulae]|uniref:TadE/TadG family type IV pilus assembly protein n=1 Tax=Rhodopirellula halodulae TaxID=2894198 RepID=UPI001E46B65A|nr:TadE/TadG family type IV pilus assembly protein [Rhodopirellula sp. JC737]MCC9655253.1 pilus assembly protein [Rhodopirellula sp. JC737]
MKRRTISKIVIPDPMCFRESKSHRQSRRGATAVEAAFTLPLLLWILLALLDLGTAAIRMNALSDTARRIGRRATLHGSMSPPANGTWGPESFSGNMVSGTHYAGNLQAFLPTMDPESVSMKVEWPDGEQRPGDRVRVQLEFTHDSLVPGLFPWGPFELQGTSTMTIVN